MIDTAATPDIVPPVRWCSSRAKSAARPARTTPRGRSPSRSFARRSSRCSSGCAATTAATPEQILDLKVCDPAMGSGAFLVEACRQLGDVLVEAWNVHGDRARDPDRRGRGDARAPARRAALPVRRRPQPGRGRPREDVALARDARAASIRSPSSTTRCATAIRSSAYRVARSTPSTGSRRPRHLRTDRASAGTHQATELRRQIRRGRRRTSDRAAQNLGHAQTDLNQVGFSATWSSRPSSPATTTGNGRPSGWSWPRQLCREGRITTSRAARGVARSERRAIVPFHWEVELPEVFDRNRPGFDAIVGNPPFGGTRSRDAADALLLDWLKEIPTKRATATPTWWRISIGGVSTVRRDGASVSSRRTRSDKVTRGQPDCAGSAPRRSSFTTP